MIDAIIQFFERLITQFSWRRLLFVLTILFIFISALVAYETYTSHFRFNKIDQETKLLNQLTELSKKIKEQNGERLTNIFKAILQDLEMHVNYGYPAFILHPVLLKAMAAAFPWVLMLLLFLFTGKTPKQTYAGTILFAIPFIIIGICLPNFPRSWINYLLYPFGHFALILMAVMIWQNRKKKLSWFVLLPRTGCFMSNTQQLDSLERKQPLPMI